jgi:GH25 family lysozyme M1 (1,4-beta-N-acetylmuramidase)
MKLNKLNLFKAITLLEGFVIVGLAVSTGIFASKYNATVPANADSNIRIRPYIDKEETFYQLNGEKILVHNSTMGETFIPVFADIPKSPIEPSEIVKDGKGFVKYTGNDGLQSKIGIDVSEYQGVINWEQVKNAGVEFAIIRAGYRTYGGGLITIDNSLITNIDGAAAAGIDVGVYFFSQAITPEEAIEEADAVLNAVAGRNITYPIVFDWEIIYDDTARTDTMTVEGLADCCVAFCERVKSAGYTPMVYQNASTSTHKLDLPRIKDYDFWLAEYTDADKPTYGGTYGLWQYTSSGRLNGIEGRVDFNLCFWNFGDEEEERNNDEW